jgi:hypothetical protein
VILVQQTDSRLNLRKEKECSWILEWKILSFALHVPTLLAGRSFFTSTTWERDHGERKEGEAGLRLDVQGAAGKD